MISFIHCGSEKGVYRFPSGNKLADAREGVTHSNSLTKNLTPFEDSAEIRLLNSHVDSQKIPIPSANSQKILLSRLLHPKLISTLNFLSN